MKRLLLLLAVGTLMSPRIAFGYSGFQFPVDNYGNIILQHFGHVNPYYDNELHVGEDAGFSGAADNLVVHAAGDGVVKYCRQYGWCNGCVYPTPSTSGGWGWIIVIEHSLPAGDKYGNKVCTIYGHEDPATVLVSEGQTVSKGDPLAEVGHHECWTDHVHFGVYKSAFGSMPNGGCGTPYPKFADGVFIAGYLPPASYPGNYANPTDFVNDHLNTTPTYHCAYVSQGPPNGTWVKPGNVYTYWVKYRNDGSDYWDNSQNTSDAHSVELWSCDVNGAHVNSWFTPVGWINAIRVKGFDGSGNVNTNGVATFTFQAQIPSASTGLKQIYFRPTHGGQDMESWGGMYFGVNVDADPPTAFTASVNPGTNNVNSFSFSWTASSDAASGLYGYYWSVNGGAETFTTSTSLPAGAYAAVQGANTFNLRAADNVGNSTSAPPVTFTLTSSPCPGREIPHTCVTYPATPCYPAQTANLQTLPELTPEQWQNVGQSVGTVLQPNVQYSLGLEYRSTTATEIKLGLGSFNPNASNPDLVIGESTLPVSANDWKTFWSAPFTVTADQLKNLSVLRLIRPVGSDGGIEYRNVRILAYRP